MDELVDNITAVAEVGTAHLQSKTFETAGPVISFGMELEEIDGRTLIHAPQAGCFVVDIKLRSYVLDKVVTQTKKHRLSTPFRAFDKSELLLLVMLCYVMLCYVILGIATADVLPLHSTNYSKFYNRATAIVIIEEGKLGLKQLLKVALSHLGIIPAEDYRHC